MDKERFLGLYSPNLIPEEEIVSALTQSGTAPLEQVFLVGNSIERWVPESECLLVTILEDASLSGLQGLFDPQGTSVLKSQ